MMYVIFDENHILGLAQMKMRFKLNHDKRITLGGSLFHRFGKPGELSSFTIHHSLDHENWIKDRMTPIS